jgi:catechol 1,2-dioxygenase
MGRHPNRAAHLHFIVTARGFDPVITHIFTPDCPYLPEDAVFGVKRELIANFNKIDDPRAGERVGLSSPFWSVSWDFTLAMAGQPTREST